ncbi:EAL domain-containing protein, partial [Actinoplanes sp. NPDC051411]|uniref:EAL domain-containing protein n=1 Tax=Actinoplanes sp. NPDC051411 TaxID=3155522 RepID=UPI0034449238
VEALLRWRHPTRGLLVPPVFLPIAEESDLGVKIGTWVLRTACHQIAAWQHPAMRMSVNVSNRQFWHGNLIEDVVESLTAENLDPSSLAWSGNWAAPTARATSSPGRSRPAN